MRMQFNSYREDLPTIEKKNTDDVRSNNKKTAHATHDTENGHKLNFEEAIIISAAFCFCVMLCYQFVI